MAPQNDSGQVMLTCAFLLAIILVIITLMLNNVIYSNNVAYLGFMGQAGDEQRTIRQTTFDESALAYQESGGDPALFQQYMRDYAGAVNSLMVPEGLYLTVSPSASPIPAGGPATTYQATDTLVNIYEKDFSYAYHVTTNYAYDGGLPPATPTPTPTPSASPSPTPTPVPSISLGTNTTSIANDGVASALITVQVTDQRTHLYLPNTVVSLSASAGTFENLTSSNPISSVVTDASGKATCKYLSLVQGRQTLYAANGSATSNPIVIDCEPVIPQGTLTNPPYTGTPTATYSTKKSGQLTLEYITVAVPVNIDPGTYDYRNFNTQITVQSASNLELLSSGDATNINEKKDVTGPGAYGNQVSAKLHWIDDTRPFSVVLNVTISAVDVTNNVAYSKSTLVAYSGPPPGSLAPPPPPAFDHFTLTASSPWTGTAGDKLTVTAYDQYGNVYTGYRGSVYFTSSVGNDNLVYWNSGHSYTFTAGDSGAHVFQSAATLKKVSGSHTITVTDGSHQVSTSVAY